MNAEVISGLGAFLSGAGSVIGGAYVVRLVHRKDQEECQRRVDEVRETFRQGMSTGLSLEERHEDP